MISIRKNGRTRDSGAAPLTARRGFAVKIRR